MDYGNRFSNNDGYIIQLTSAGTKGACAVLFANVQH